MKSAHKVTGSPSKNEIQIEHPHPGIQLVGFFYMQYELLICFRNIAYRL